MNVSVIICTHNPREEYLRRVLEGLRAQTLALDQWELLLVDNASRHPLSSRFDISWHPHAWHLREEELGLTPARLRGIKKSTAGILVFVDDDTVLTSDYLTQALQVGRAWPFIGVWGGNCIPEYEKPLPPWVGDEVWRLTVVDVKEDIWSNSREDFRTIPAGAGMCLRRPVGESFARRCEKQKNFRIMGRTGTALTGYEDVELAYCALDLGLGTGKTSRLRLTHLVPASRLTLDYFVRHAEGDAASLVMFLVTRGLPITPPQKPTLLQSARWFLHRTFHRIPREQIEIIEAHQRGRKRGWQAAQQYLQQNNQISPPPQLPPA